VESPGRATEQSPQEGRGHDQPEESHGPAGIKSIPAGPYKLITLMLLLLFHMK